jgi:hypothetical protein
MHGLIRLFAAERAAAADPGARHALDRLFNRYLRAVERQAMADSLIHPAGISQRPAQKLNAAKGLSMPG